MLSEDQIFLEFPLFPLTAALETQLEGSSIISIWDSVALGSWALMKSELGTSQI